MSTLYRYDETIRSIAHEHAALLTEEKRFSRENTQMNPLGNQVGAIFQYGLTAKLVELGHDVECTPFYVPGLARDDYDLKVYGKTVDAKGFTKDPYPIRDRTRVFVDLNDEGKAIDYYAFGFVEQSAWLIHFLGVISYKRFWDPKFDGNITTFQKNGLENTSRFVTVADLLSFDRYLSYLSQFRDAPEDYLASYAAVIRAAREKS